MKRSIALIYGLLGFVAVFKPSTALAQPVVINFAERGWYASTGDTDANTDNSNYVVGDTREPGCGLCDGSYRNFFVFDLSAITQPIGSATLAIAMPNPSGYLSNDPSETYELHDVTTSIASLMNGTGGVAANADLGDGVVYGSRAMTAADVGKVIEITLNSSALAAMNSSHGWFGIGGTITTLDNLPNYEAVFAYSGNPFDPSQLRLTLVPEPTGPTLIALAAISFAGRRGRQRTLARDFRRAS